MSPPLHLSKFRSWLDWIRQSRTARFVIWILALSVSLGILQLNLQHVPQVWLRVLIALVALAAVFALLADIWAAWQGRKTRQRRHQGRHR